MLRSSAHPGAPLAGRPIRTAVVGAGFIADFHLEILRRTPGVEVVGVCDVDRERARRSAERWGLDGARAAVAGAGELDGLGVDVAHVLVPPHLHEEVTRRLLELGIGVFVEKPFALSTATARELGELAAQRRLPLGVNHNFLYHPAYRRLRERVASGELGRVEHVRCCWNLPLSQLEAGKLSHWMFRSPENIVFEQGPHPFAMIHALVGRVVEAAPVLLGSRELPTGATFHHRWAMAARAERGTAQLFFALGQGLPRSTIEALCTDGAAEADLVHDQMVTEQKTPYLDFWNSFLAARRRGRTLSRGAWRNLFRYSRFTLGLGPRRDPFFIGMGDSIGSFYAALRRGEVPPVGAPEAVEVLEWCEALAAAVPRPEAAAASQTGGRPAPAPEAREGEIAVLGGAGFIGRRVVSRLLEGGRPVTVLARSLHGLPPELTRAAASGALRLLPGSLEDRESLAAALRGARSVVHLATGGGSTWDEVERSMVGGTVAVAELCLELGVERLIYVSSIAALYLGSEAGPEIDDGWQTDPRPQDRDLYSRGKIAAEGALKKLYDERGLPVVVARPGVVLGEGTAMQHSGLGLWVRDNHCVGWGRGDHPLPLVWVDDVVAALVDLALRHETDLEGQALNLCARPPLTAAEVVAELARVTGRALRFHPRPLWLSQVMEIGKWLIKVAGRRPGTRFPSYRDLKSRSLAPAFTCRVARTRLGWRPVEEREELLDRVVRVYGS